MEVKIPNGTLLHRMWLDSDSAELVAACQYSTDAEDIARMMMERDNKQQLGRSIYIATCTGSGKVKIFRAKAEKSQ